MGGKAYRAPSARSVSFWSCSDWPAKRGAWRVASSQGVEECQGDAGRQGDRDIVIQRQGEALRHRRDDGPCEGGGGREERQGHEKGCHQEGTCSRQGFSLCEPVG